MVNLQQVLSKLDKDSREALLSMAERRVLNQELDSLTEEIVATRQALQLENADKNFLTDRARNLGHRLERIKRKRSELETREERLRLELLIEAIEQSKPLQSNDHGQSPSWRAGESTIPDDFSFVQFSEIKEELNSEIEAAKTSIGFLKDAVQKLEEQIVELRAQYDIGDLSRSRFMNAQSKIERNMALLETCERILRQKISQAEKLLE